MIDIVVTYLNERDKKWQEAFKYWKDKEILQGIAREDNRQAFGEERTREWDTFKYWLRGVEENCKWVNKIFIVVQNKNHVPKWLNVNHPKIRIVYHDEYIPITLLPTFNAMTINMYTSNIHDLSEHYIMCDDDYYFLNPIKEDRFFRKNRPVHKDNKIPFIFYGDNLLEGSDGVFYSILNNDLRFETMFMKDGLVKYDMYHLPEARSKSFEQAILNRYKDSIYNANSISKFRNEHNLCAYMYNDLLKICNRAYIDDPYYNCAYVTLKSNVDFYKYKDKDIVCFNDTEQLDNYELTKKHLIDFFEKKFPNKSSFELED